MWIQLVAFFPCNFRFSSFTWLSASTPNTKSHIQSNALPAFLGNITTSPLNFRARWSPFFILSQRTLAVVEPSGSGEIHGFYHRFGDMIQLQQWIYTGWKMQCRKINPELVPSSLTRFFILRESRAFILMRFRDPSVVTLSVRGCSKLSKHSGARSRSQPRLVLLIDSKARNSSRISHWPLISGIKISSWAVSLISVLW